MQKKISNNLVTYFDLLHKLEEEFAFAYDNEIGYLNTLPINSGSATFFSCKIKIPKNEFNKAQEYNDDYALIVISNLDEHPNMNVIFNPVTHINLTPKTITSTQLNYHSDSISWKNLS